MTTLRMLDSIFPENLPAGADAYLGYVGGDWVTVPSLRTLFPRVPVLDMAIASSEDATGCDYEKGDLTEAQVPGWVKRQLARGVWRPVVYASADSMPGVVAALAAAGIGRASVRLLSAHYAGKHVCGPASCGYRDGAGRVVPACDGTQWTDQAAGLHGSRIDESLLDAGFFVAAPPPAPKLPPAKKESEMILIQVDRAGVPKGAAWPGVFLLASDATLHHVTGPAAGDSTNNAEAYQKAGIPGPVTISYHEYLARGGKPAVPATA